MSIARDPTYEKLYEEILLSLQPLPYIPFQLSLTFEVQSSTDLSLSNVGGSGSRSVSPAPFTSHEFTPVRNLLVYDIYMYVLVLFVGGAS